MVVHNCFHPNSFTNPYTGEEVTASCGKCDACRNTRASEWVMRLDLEASCHKYVLFCTLTYDELNVPQIIRLRYEDYPEQTPAYINSDTGVIIETSEIRERFTAKDFEYCRNTKVLQYLDKSDFQRFIKRLRYYFRETDPEALLRYYICGEYGPTTYRPHGHMLLFFDSDQCAKDIEVLLCKAWPFGNIYDPHFVEGSAAKYCASYINSSSKLPKVYLHKEIRPFSLFSKSPAIGSLFPNVAQVREIFDRGVITFRRFDDTTHAFKDEPFWRSFESRLFPRCQRFGSLLHADRVALYRLYEGFAKYDLSAREIAKRLKYEYLDSNRNDFFGRYFREIAYKSVYGVKFQKLEFNKEYSDMPFAPNFPIEQPFLTQRTKVRVYNENSLVRFAASISCLYHQAKLFGVSIEEYVCKIENYYEKKLKDKWSKDYNMQSEYFQIYPKWHWIYFDFGFYKKVISTPYSGLSDASRFTIEELFEGCVPLSVRKDNEYYLNIPSFEDLPVVKRHFLLHKKIASDLVKQKHNNDYALANKDKFNNVLTYQNV